MFVMTVWLALMPAWEREREPCLMLGSYSTTVDMMTMASEDRTVYIQWVMNQWAWIIAHSNVLIVYMVGPGGCQPCQLRNKENKCAMERLYSIQNWLLRGFVQGRLSWWTIIYIIFIKKKFRSEHFPLSLAILPYSCVWVNNPSFVVSRFLFIVQNLLSDVRWQNNPILRIQYNPFLQKRCHRF
jgi:hypothetical protein